MKMRRALTVLGLSLASVCAQAGVIYNVSAPNTYTSGQAGVTTVNFNNGTCGAYIACYGNGILTSGSVSGLYASPLGITDTYLSVPYYSSNGQVTLVTPGSNNYFGLYWGSVDAYNAISFYSGASLIGSFGGSDISPPLSADGNQTAWSSNRYVNFFLTNGSSFDRIVISSTNYAFESDNHAFGNVSVPEPSTLAVMALGLFGVGMLRLRRNARSKM